jgi:hypothetical protein
MAHVAGKDGDVARTCPDISRSTVIQLMRADKIPGLPGSLLAGEATGDGDVSRQCLETILF